ncbi:unnamed protein product [Amoebophrya sp. A120]|nr:unnamed protein product [Amoebophrya sp. A120]|eukprot:GSA120T00002474001.1
MARGKGKGGGGRLAVFFCSTVTWGSFCEIRGILAASPYHDDVSSAVARKAPFSVAASASTASATSSLAASCSTGDRTKTKNGSESGTFNNSLSFASKSADADRGHTARNDVSRIILEDETVSPDMLDALRTSPQSDLTDLANLIRSSLAIEDDSIISEGATSTTRGGSGSGSATMIPPPHVPGCTSSGTVVGESFIMKKTASTSTLTKGNIKAASTTSATLPLGSSAVAATTGTLFASLSRRASGAGSGKAKRSAEMLGADLLTFLRDELARTSHTVEHQSKAHGYMWRDQERQTCMQQCQHHHLLDDRSHSPRKGKQANKHDEHKQHQQLRRRLDAMQSRRKQSIEKYLAGVLDRMADGQQGRERHARAPAAQKKEEQNFLWEAFAHFVYYLEPLYDDAYQHQMATLREHVPQGRQLVRTAKGMQIFDREVSDLFIDALQYLLQNIDWEKRGEAVLREHGNDATRVGLFNGRKLAASGQHNSSPTGTTSASQRHEDDKKYFEENHSEFWLYVLAHQMQTLPHGILMHIGYFGRAWITDDRGRKLVAPVGNNSFRPDDNWQRVLFVGGHWNYRSDGNFSNRALTFRLRDSATRTRLLSDLTQLHQIIAKRDALVRRANDLHDKAVALYQHAGTIGLQKMRKECSAIMGLQTQLEREHYGTLKPAWSQVFSSSVVLPAAILKRMHGPPEQSSASFPTQGAIELLQAPVFHFRRLEKEDAFSVHVHVGAGLSRDETESDRSNKSFPDDEHVPAAAMRYLTSFITMSMHSNLVRKIFPDGAPASSDRNHSSKPCKTGAARPVKQKINQVYLDCYIELEHLDEQQELDGHIGNKLPLVASGTTFPCRFMCKGRDSTFGAAHAGDDDVLGPGNDNQYAEFFLAFPTTNREYFALMAELVHLAVQSGYLDAQTGDDVGDVLTQYMIMDLMLEKSASGEGDGHGEPLTAPAAFLQLLDLPFEVEPTGTDGGEELVGAARDAGEGGSAVADFLARIRAMNREAGARAAKADARTQSLRRDQRKVTKPHKVSKKARTTGGGANKAKLQSDAPSTNFLSSAEDASTRQHSRLSPEEDHSVWTEVQNFMKQLREDRVYRREIRPLLSKRATDRLKMHKLASLIKHLQASFDKTRRELQRGSLVSLDEQKQERLSFVDADFSHTPANHDAGRSTSLSQPPPGIAVESRTMGPRGGSSHATIKTQVFQLQQQLQTHLHDMEEAWKTSCTNLIGKTAVTLITEHGKYKDTTVSLSTAQRIIKRMLDAIVGVA